MNSKAWFTMAGVAVVLLGTQVKQVQACIFHVAEKHVYYVNMPGTEIVRAMTDDLIRMEYAVPADPEHVDAKVEVIYDDQVLRMVARNSRTEEYPDRAAAELMGNIYYFKVVGAGETTVVIRLVGRDGRILLSREQKVQASQAPIYRGC